MNRNSNRSMLTLLIGAALGAAGVYLSDKKNRDKVKSKIDEIKARSSEKVDEMKAKGSEGLGRIQEKLDEGRAKAEKEIEEAQNKLES